MAQQFHSNVQFNDAVEIKSSSINDFLKLTSGGSSANPVKLIFEKGASEQGVIEYNRNGDLEIYNTDGDGGVMISGSASADPDFFISHAGASTFKSTLTVGEDDTGHDVKFFGATSGASFLYDESEDRVTITGPTDEAQLELYTISGGQPTVPQLKIGRSGNQYWGVYTDDRIAHIVHRQDETSGTMSTYFEQWDSNTSDALGQWVFRYGDGNGSSMAEALTLTQAGDLTLVGDIIHSGDTNTKIGFSAADTFQVETGGSARLTIGNSLATFANAVTVTGNLTANGNIVGDNSTNITNIGSVETGNVASAGDNTTRIDMGATQIDCLVADTDVFQVTDSTFTFDPAVKTSIHKRHLAKTSNTDGDADGDIVYFGGTTSMTAGKIYHYKSDGTWELADADSAATCDGLLGVALGAASDTNGVLLRGMVTIANDPGAVGDVLFVSTSAGQAIATAPSGSGDIVRVVGYCLDASNGQIYFNPDGAFVEVA
jgi:hypothetical protein